MKIGLIIYGSLDNLSGGYLYDRKLVEYLRQQGEQVEIISLPWRNYIAHLLDNWKVRLPKPFEGFDVIIQDELNHPSLIIANSIRQTYPVISLVHHLRCSENFPAWQRWFYKLVEKRYLSSVDGFIFNSNTTSHVVTNIVGKFMPSVTVFPPTDRFGGALSEKIITDRAYEPGPLRLVFLGNIIPRKGLNLLLEAIKILGSECKLNVVGSQDVDPVYASQVREVANQPDLRDKVFFYGKLDDEVLAKVLQASHVLVVPSSYEGFGIVYLEGMAFGLPAIGTTAGAAGEIINDGENGFLVPPEDALKLASCLKTLAGEKELLVRMSLNALERYRNQPSWDQTAWKIRNFLYEMVIQKGYK